MTRTPLRFVAAWLPAGLANRGTLAAALRQPRLALLLPLVPLVVLLLAVPAWAQPRPITPACRQECNAPARDLAANPPAVQACLIRCQAGSDFTRGINAAPRRALGTTVATAPTSGTWAVAYAATPPNGATGTSHGLHDRNQAHMEAERACAARAGARCRPLAEAGPGECLAIAQAGRVTGLVRTTDPRTFQVTLVEYGKAPDAAAAGRAAVSACSGRGQCEVVATVCGSR